MNCFRTIGCSAVAVLFGIFFVVGAAATAWGDEPEKGHGADAKIKAEEKDKKEAEGEKEEPKEHFLALMGGDVYTVTGPVLRGVTVLSKDGVIVDVGRDLHLPEGCEVLDVTGYRVYPGLVAVSSSRILGYEPPEDTTDLYGINMVLGLSAGLTTVVTGNTAAKLTYGTNEGMVVKKGLFTTLRYSRNRSYQRRELREDFEKVRQYLRDVKVYERKKAAGDSEAKEPDKKWLRGKYSTYLKLLTGEITALMSVDQTQDLRDAAELSNRFGFKLVIRGGIEAWTMAPELGRKGISMIITPRRKTAYGRRYDPDGEDEIGQFAGQGGGKTGGSEPQGGTEPIDECCDEPGLVEDRGADLERKGLLAWLTAGELCEEDVLHEDEELQPDQGAWGNDRLLRPTGWTIENASVLYESGVPFAIIPQSTAISMGGIVGRGLLMMPMEAAFAVRGGLPEHAAIEAITIGAARILGIDDQVGSIEVGKDADLIVCDGDLLHYKTMVQWTVVNGKIAYDKEKESLFAHIRPRGKAGTEAKPEFWPRDFGPMPSFEPEVEPPEPGRKKEDQEDKGNKDND